MEETRLVLKRKNYKLNNFQVKPSKGYYTHEIFFLYFLNKNIGCFNSKNSLITDRNGTQNYFLIYPILGKNTIKNIFSCPKIGTISFLFNDDNKWEIKYVTLHTIPEHLLTERKVLIEKNKL